MRVYRDTLPTLSQRTLDRQLVSTNGEYVNTSAFEDVKPLVSFPCTFKGVVPPAPQLVLDTVRHLADATRAVLSNVQTTQRRLEESTPPPLSGERGGAAYTNTTIPTRHKKVKKDTIVAQRKAKTVDRTKNIKMQERLEGYIYTLKQIVRETERLNKEWEIITSDLEFK